MADLTTMIGRTHTPDHRGGVVRWSTRGEPGPMPQELLVTLTAPGELVDEWARFALAVVTDIPAEGVPEGVTLVMVDPQVIVRQ
jgi:hypothetical protein